MLGRWLQSPRADGAAHDRDYGYARVSYAHDCLLHASACVHVTARADDAHEHVSRSDRHGSALHEGDAASSPHRWSNRHRPNDHADATRRL
jgi:hypothetical protein